MPDQLDFYVEDLKAYIGKTVHVIYLVKYVDTRIVGENQGKDIPGFFKVNEIGQLTSVSREAVVLTQAHKIVSIAMDAVETISDEIPRPKNRLVAFEPCTKPDK